MPAELALERAPRLHEQRAVDRLVRDLHPLIVGVLEPQPSSDLLRRVIKAQTLPHQRRELGAALELRRLRTPSTQPSLLVSEVRAITAPAPATAYLARDRRVRTTKRTPDLTIRIAARDPARDLLPLRQAQTPLGTPPRTT